MTAARYDLVWEQGTTIATGFILHDPAPEDAEPDELGPVVDLTGWTARMQVRSTLGSDIVLHSFTTENGGIELGDDGSILILATDTQSAAWDWPHSSRSTKALAVYDLELEDPDGTVKRFLEGKVTLKLEVTRDD